MRRSVPAPVSEPVLSVVAFDPGGTIGWAVFSVWESALLVSGVKILDSVVFWKAGEFTGTEVARVSAMLDLADSWESADLVSEDFVVNEAVTGVGSSADILSPIRLNAAFAYGLAVRARVLLYQIPALAAKMIDDEMLKRTGFWDALAGQPHARDGVRHALTYLRRRKRANLLKAKASAHA